MGRPGWSSMAADPPWPITRCPGLASGIPARIRSRVYLPDPFGPIRPEVSPAPTCGRKEKAWTDFHGRQTKLRAVLRSSPRWRRNRHAGTAVSRPGAICACGIGRIASTTSARDLEPMCATVRVIMAKPVSVAISTSARNCPPLRGRDQGRSGWNRSQTGVGSGGQAGPRSSLRRRRRSAIRPRRGWGVKLIEVVRTAQVAEQMSTALRGGQKHARSSADPLPAPLAGPDICRLRRDPREAGPSGNRTRPLLAGVRRRIGKLDDLIPSTGARCCRPRAHRLKWSPS